MPKDARETWSGAATPLFAALGQAILQREAIDARIATLRAEIKALDGTLSLAMALTEKEPEAARPNGHAEATG